MAGTSSGFGTNAGGGTTPLPAVLSRLRLVTGCWLLFYAATHLSNHALRLVSVAAAESGRTNFLAFWRVPAIELSLAMALLIHVALGLWKLWQRRTPRMRPVEALQLGLGLVIPSYLTVHVLATGWLYRCCGVEDSYHYFLSTVWAGGGISQTIMTIVVWSHGMIGLHEWLRLRRGHVPLRPWLLVLAVLLPAFGLGAFLSAGREVGQLRASDPDALATIAAAQGWPSPALREAMVTTPEAWVVRGFLVLVAAIFLLLAVRWLWLRRYTVRLDYPGGRRASVPQGLTILEASKVAGIPHAAVCGGRGRCSTCRMRVGHSADRLPPPHSPERRVLDRIGAPADVRLACQARLSADLALTPLMPATVGPAEAMSVLLQASGVEREIAVMSCDLRGFTSLSEGRLPYDTVFILNRYFRAMGEVIEAAGGRVDKFIGDASWPCSGWAATRAAGRAQHSPPCASWPKRSIASTATSRLNSTRRCGWTWACMSGRSSWAR
jgi:adenylate cyclase